ncbi:MAG: serine/threonine-protein kinase [Microcoleus sp.]
MYPERHWRRLQGETVNKQYYLEEYLGCGGYGAVYKADEVIKDDFIREVAIKLIALEEDETKAKKQLNEIRAAANLLHENIIRSYTVGCCEVKEDEYLFIVMEIATITLEKKLKTGKLSITEVQKIVRDTAAVLNYLHNSDPRKVHRDIKPANLLYAADKWKVSDLGLLREIGTNSLRTQDIKGTPSYVPPESYQGVVGTGWDMWSLGIMTAEILTGTLPFTGNTDQELMKKIMEEQPEIDWSKIPEPFTAIVRGCLEKERSKRWTAEQVLTALAPSPEPKPAPPEIQLISAVGMDYTNLRNLLAAKKWKEADEETARVMLKVAGREEEGWLNSELESIDNFPCEDLRTIDQLWVQYSNGRFGFSVQKRIYQSLGGTREYDEKVWEAFSDKVGWRKNNSGLYYKEITFSEKAPEAHLPCGVFYYQFGLEMCLLMMGKGFGVSSSLASRLVKCNI